MTSCLLMCGIGIFGLVVFAGWLLTVQLDTYSSGVRDRLQRMPKDKFSNSVLSYSDDVTVQGSKQEFIKAFLHRLVPNGEADRQRYQSRLIQAGIYSPTALSIFFAVKLALMILPPAAWLVFAWTSKVDLRAGLLWSCLLGVLGMIVPAIWLDHRIRCRHLILRNSFPDFLDLMIVCLEGGLSLQGSIRQVSDEMKLIHHTLASELNIVQREIELGLSADTSLRRFADRSGFEGIRTLSTFMREAQRLGTELADALRQQADMLRSQRELAAEESAQKASVKILLPTMLLILPAVFVVLAGPAAIQIHQAFTK